MNESVEVSKMMNLLLCDKLINELSINEDDTDSFFGGSIYKAYIDANDKAMEKAKKIKLKLKNI